MANAPIAGRVGEAVVWTGQEMLVWGGLPRLDPQNWQPATDGAAYNPATDTWRRIADPPAGTVGVPAGAVWTGAKVVIYGGNAPDGPAVAAVYDSATDSWRILPAGPLGSREGFITVWTGEEMIVLGGASGDGFPTPIAAAVNPETGTWRLLAEINKVMGLEPTSAFWTGTELLLTGTVSHCDHFPAGGGFHPGDPGCTNLTPFLGEFDPSTGALTSLKSEASPQATEGSTWYGAASGALGAAQAWTGSDLLFVERNGDAFRTRIFTRSTNTWRTMAVPPCTPSEDATYYAAGVPEFWTGTQLLFPCGATRLAVYSPTAETWAVIDTGTSPLSARSGPAVVWTGTNLIVWSGAEFAVTNPTPNSGAIFALSGA